MAIKNDDPKRSQSRTIGTVLLLIGAGFLLLNLFLPQLFSPNVPRVPYSVFIDQVGDGKVSRAYVAQDQIRYQLKTEAGEPGQILATTPIFDLELPQRLEENGVEFAAAPPKGNNWFATALSWVIPPLIFVGIWQFFLRRSMGGGGPQGALSITKSKAKVYVESDGTKVGFADVAGVEEAKAELEEIVEFLRDSQRYLNIGARIPKGVLLVGPPGTGKTLLAKAVAGEAGVPFFSISGSEFVELFVGAGAARVRDLFEQAKQKAPCIIFIDELDALGKARGFGTLGGHDEREQTLNQLLVEMDGFDPQVGVILLAATNRPEILDPALLRPGRFDRQVLVDRPDRKGREAILRVHLKKIRYDETVDVATIANMTPGMVGADLANIVNEAALLAVRRGKEAAGMAEFQEAVERVIAGLEKKNRVINPHEKRIVAYHELGHAIVAMSLPGTDPVQKITVIPRGIAALGYTLQVPTEDRFLMSKSELENKIATLLGGRAAEELVIGDISTGAHNDLSRATDIARSMVKEYGMGSIGQVYYASNRRAQFLGGIPGESRGEYSEATAEQIDREVNEIIRRQYARALEILGQKRPLLERAVGVLLEKETIAGEELKALMEEAGPAAPGPGAAAG